MTLQNIVQLFDAQVICGSQHLHKEVKHAFAADLMSDVLRIDTTAMILITGLVNPQVIRTAEMSDINIILFVRDKKVTPEMVELAEDSNIALIQCRQSMFNVCGQLYKNGVEALF